MNKLKVFAFSFLLFFTVAIVPTFAQENSFPSPDKVPVEDIIQDNNLFNVFDGYFVTVTHTGASDDYGYFYVSFTSSPFTYNGVLSTSGDVYKCNAYDNTCSLRTQAGSFGFDSSSIIWTNYDLLFSNGDVFFYNQALPTYLQSATITQTIQTIPDLLMGLLTVILPTGLAILGLVLGVSLVKRLVHLFL